MDKAVLFGALFVLAMSIFLLSFVGVDHQENKTCDHYCFENAIQTGKCDRSMKLTDPGDNWIGIC